MADGAVSLAILGANGDLTRRRLIPALFSLYCKGGLPDNLKVVGVSRTAYSDDEFRRLMWESAVEFGGASGHRGEFGRFAKLLHYMPGDVGNPEDATRLKRRLEELEGGAGPEGRLFYLSIAPQLYGPAIEVLGGSGLATDVPGWQRVVIEKPFGFDLASATDLNKVVHARFDESQIYRIDHYLGKETVQNLMVLRFANSIFEPIWNRNYVKCVQITVAEEVDVAGRGSYYDRSGVIRDMVQNHLLQLLTIVAMEPPVTADAESLRDRKVDVLHSIRPWARADVAANTVAGQYGGYRDEEGVPADSKTATYAAMRLFVDNWRWNGVPFYLRTGKTLRQKLTEIIIEFQVPPHLVFSGDASQPESPPNILAICIQPNEGARLRFQVKVPGRGMEMRPVDMEFDYASAFSEQGIPEAYERLLQDAFDGDASLFIRSDQIEEAWRVVDPIIEAWESPDASQPLTYERGSDGPAAADALLAEAGDTWLEGGCGGHTG